MQILKTVNSNVSIQKVTGITKDGKKYTSYRIVFNDIDTMPLFVDTYKPAGNRLASYVDFCGLDVCTDDIKEN